MNFGQGAISFVNNSNPGGGGAVTAMQNGLSLIGTLGELGLNPLLHDTRIDDAGNNFEIGQTGGDITVDFLGIFPAILTTSLTGGGDSAQLLLQSNIRFATLGGGPQVGRANFVVNAANNIFQMITNPANRFFEINLNGQGTYWYGDIDSTLNNNSVLLNDSTQAFTVGRNPGKTSIEVDLNLCQLLLGDIDTSNTGSYLNLQPAQRIMQGFFGIGTGPALELDGVNDTYKIGDINSDGNGVVLNVDNGNSRIQFTQDINLWFDVQANGITTAGPTGAGTAGQWLLGKNVVAAVILDATQYLEISVDGVLYKLALVN